MTNVRRLIAAVLIMALWGALDAFPRPPLALASNGDRIDGCSGTGTAIMRCWKMVDAASSTTNGQWVSFDGMMTANLHISGISAGATLQIYGSNAVSTPDNATDGQQIGSNITSNGFTQIVGPYRWVKVKVSVNGGGDIVNAYLAASNAGGGGGTGGTAGAVTQGTSPWAVTLQTASGTATGADASSPINVTVPASGNNLCSGRTILSLASSDTKTNCKSTSGVLYDSTFLNLTTTTFCAKLYATTGLPNVGTDSPKVTITIPGASSVGAVGGIVTKFGPDGLAFTNGIAFALTGLTTGLCSDAGTNLAATGVLINLPYR